MSTINVSGAGAGGEPPAPENNQPQQTPEQMLAGAVKAGRKLQQANREITDFFGSFGEATRKAFEQAARKEREEESKLRSQQTAQQRREQQAATQQATKERQQQTYLNRVRATSIRWEEQAKDKEAREEKRATEQAARKVTADQKYLTKVRMTSMKWEADAKEKAQDDIERAEQQAVSARHARLRNYGRFARTTAMVVNGIHGDVEGASAGIGAGIGALAGGPIGAEIGEVAGEIVAKLGKAILMAPLALGSAWSGYMGMSQPYFTPQRQAADLGGAGGFRGDDLFNSIRKPGQFGAQPWMAYYGRGQSEALQMLADVGVNPRSASEGTGMIQNMLAAGYSPGFRGLGDQVITGTLGQGLSAGLTTPAGASKYLGQFGTVLQKGIPIDIDRSKLLNRMTDAIEQMVKGGGSVNTGDMTDMFTRFMMAGGPGRGGDNAAANMGSVDSTLNNLSGSTATLYNFQRIAGRYNNFKSDEDIKSALGPEGWENLQKEGASRAILDRIKAGNIYTQSQLLGPFFPRQRYQDVTNDLNSGVPLGARDAVVAGALNSGPLGPLNNIRNQYGRTVGGVDGGNIHPGPSGEDAILAQKVASGTASAAETVRLLTSYGVPTEEIGTIMSEAQRRGINPMMFAVEGWHESKFQLHPKDNLNKNGTVDRGLFQINSVHDKEDPLQGDRYDMRYQARKLGDVLTNDDKSPANLRRANWNDPDWVNYIGTQQGWLGDQGNIPAENQYKANADSSSVEGAKTMSENLGGSMLKLTTGVDDATAAVQRFARALDAARSDDNSMPDQPTDLMSRIGHAAVRGAVLGIGGVLP